MNRFSGGYNNLYGGEINQEDTIKDTTTDLFKKSNKQEEKTTNSYILSNDLTRVLKKNRELYNYIELLETEKKELQDTIKSLEKKILLINNK